MSTDHAAEALAMLHHVDNAYSLGPTDRVAVAQVHATLALADALDVKPEVQTREEPAASLHSAALAQVDGSPGAPGGVDGSDPGRPLWTDGDGGALTIGPSPVYAGIFVRTTTPGIYLTREQARVAGLHLLALARGERP